MTMVLNSSKNIKYLYIIAIRKFPRTSMNRTMLESLLWKRSVSKNKFTANEIASCRRSRSQMSFKIGVLKNFPIHLCWSLFLIKLPAFRPSNLLKRDSNTGVFLWSLIIFNRKQLFYRTLPLQLLLLIIEEKGIF